MPEDHDIDRVAMPSRRTDGTPDQSPGFEVIVDPEAEAEVKADEPSTTKRSAKPKGERATNTPGGEDR